MALRKFGTGKVIPEDGEPKPPPKDDPERAKLAAEVAKEAEEAEQSADDCEHEPVNDFVSCAYLYCSDCRSIVSKAEMQRTRLSVTRSIDERSLRDWEHKVARCRYLRGPHRR